jgi:hypothetical protein
MTIRPLFTRLLAGLLILSAVPAFAAKRTVAIDAPARAVAGSKVMITVTANTDAADGEKIGFFHAEYSVDGGKKWTGFCYDEKLGVKATRAVTIPVGARGSQTKVRVLVAFRGDKAGDVDFNGAPIKWDGSWGKWESPPAKLATIDVVAL